MHTSVGWWRAAGRQAGADCCTTGEGGMRPEVWRVEPVRYVRPNNIVWIHPSSADGRCPGVTSILMPSGPHLQKARIGRSELEVTRQGRVRRKQASCSCKYAVLAERSDPPGWGYSGRRLPNRTKLRARKLPRGTKLRALACRQILLPTVNLDGNATHCTSKKNQPRRKVVRHG
jgi:hypothetical protein